MKLVRVLDKMSSLGKNSFIKIIDTITSTKEKDNKEIQSILDSLDRNLKDADHYYISQIYNKVETDFTHLINEELKNSSSQLDIVIDIFIRDGNCIMSHDWFSNLYDKEILKIRKKVNEMNKIISNADGHLDQKRLRDYLIYQSCVRIAYFNDKINNCEPKITTDEQSILNTLINGLELSQEEVRLINYTIIPIEKRNIDDLIKDLKYIGILFYSKKENKIFIPDEIVKTLRSLRGKELADKHFRRVLKYIKDGQINMIARKHNIDYKLSREEKISSIINDGIPFSLVIGSSIHKDNTSIPEIKGFINNLIENDLKITLPVKGVTVEDKINNLIKYFDQVDRDDKVSISIDGYEKMLTDISMVYPKFNEVVRREFELQNEFVLHTEYLLDYNIKPRDLLYLMKDDELKNFCKTLEFSSRGDRVENVIKAYKDTDNIYMENFENLSRRDLYSLKENGIQIKESMLGIKFEDLTKKIFSQMGFDVDEKLRKKINTNKDKIDIVLNLGNNELILIECKSLKDKDLSKYSSVKRQLDAYLKLAEKNHYKVIKSLVVAPEFSDDFENECAMEYDLNISLITASSMKNIFDEFKKSKLEQFPYKLLLKDVVIREDRIIKAINK